MYKNNTIFVVLTAHNEETQIVKTIKNLPDFVDKIIVVNDASKDKTLEIVEQEIKRLYSLLEHLMLFVMLEILSLFRFL